MKRTVLMCLALAVLLLVPPPAAAQEAAKQKCTLEVGACLGMFDKMRERPWLGIEYEPQADGGLLIKRLVPGGPAEQAGMKPGDTVLTVEGVKVPEAPKLLAGKAGWRIGGKVRYRVRRDGQEQEMPVVMGQISNELLARLIGDHMVENHLASAEAGASRIN